MAGGRWVGVWMATATTLLAGCGSAPEPPTGTGAREVARGYYDALVRQDWAAAHAALHPETRARYGPEEFARLARVYRRTIGYEPQQVRVRSCEERGAEAVAHVVLAGQSGGKQRSFRDAVQLRKAGAAWGVVLPPRFGQTR
jgi:hypothetical protein